MPGHEAEVSSITRQLSSRIALLALTLLVPSTASAQTDPRVTISALRDQSNAAIAAQDLDGFLARLSPEYHVSTSSGVLLSSPGEMGEAFSSHVEMFPDAIFVRDSESIELSEGGSTASEGGVWEGRWTTPNGPYRIGGRYLASWRKIRGEWLIHSEVFVPLYCEGHDCVEGGAF